MTRSSGVLTEGELAALRIASVDSFQGQEKDIIIISCVRANPEGKVRVPCSVDGA